VTVVRLSSDPATIEAVTAGLCEAFDRYPVMRFVLGPEGDYLTRLRTLIEFFVAARVLSGHPMLAVSSGAEMLGVALCTPPGALPAPALDEVRERTWATLGADARERYEACTRSWSEVGVAVPNLHLNMLAVPPRYQGRGLARELLEAVHRLSQEYAESRGVTLSTEDPKNVPLYRRFGYQVVGHRRIAPELETWGFFRPG
jgi:GNAT superfamily N-acetyltransferase